MNVSKRNNNELTITKKLISYKGKNYVYHEVSVPLGKDPLTNKYVYKQIIAKDMNELEEKIKSTIQKIEIDGPVSLINLTYEQTTRYFLTKMKPYISNYFYDEVNSLHKSLVLPLIGNKKIKSLNEIDYQKCFRLLEEERYHQNKIHRAGTVMKKILSFAYEERIVDKDYSKLIFPPKTDIRFTKILSTEEMNNLMKELKNFRFKNVIYTILILGCTINEALGITWDDIDFVHAKLSINKVVQMGATTYGKVVLISKDWQRRIIDVPEVFLKCAYDEKRNQCIYKQKLFKFQNPNYSFKFLFSDFTGKPICPKSIQEDFRKLVNAIDLDRLTLVNLRDMSLAIMMQHGISQMTAAKYCGMKTLSTTWRICESNGIRPAKEERKLNDYFMKLIYGEQHGVYSKKNYN